MLPPVPPVLPGLLLPVLPLEFVPAGLIAEELLEVLFPPHAAEARSRARAHNNDVNERWSTAGFIFHSGYEQLDEQQVNSGDLSKVKKRADQLT